MARVWPDALGQRSKIADVTQKRATFTHPALTQQPAHLQHRPMQTYKPMQHVYHTQQQMPSSMQQIHQPIKQQMQQAPQQQTQLLP